MSMRRIRWGILSTGRIAHQFAQDLSRVDNAELVAVAARSREAAAAFAEHHHIPHAHAGYAALIADPRVDAVYVATPHTLHFEHSAAALRAGKAVLCEKPLTTSAAECAALIDVARSTGAYLMEGMWTYFLPAVRTAQQWVAAGRIGRIRHIKADFGYPLLPYDANRREYDAALAGGCLLEMGIYPIALAWLFLQQDPASMQVVARRAPNGVEDDVVMTFDYADCVATLATSFRAKLQNWAYIIGDEGYIAIPDFWRAHECMLYRLDERIDHFDDARSTLGFDHEAQAVSDDILAGRRESAIVSLSDSLRFQQHIDAVRGSFFL
ncbi:MAG TPA: Gfo/Idh/MocA family oxidoreductase [Povalibacter sp.]|uniref:Gfo/Idh/MocA family protein n=1 Tax=Povalibacter sp. TaxID=1962978 RepID=UPI002C0ABF43|nr:Gfo/Idh/MocA family oxidoreductase [Povalibacter sp.]HMN47226.1 Gfo/Idh/MocA family oxidoreductase [Povalibacter sp.]